MEPATYNQNIPIEAHMPDIMPSCTYVTDEEESQHVPQQLVNKKMKAVIYQVYLNYEFEKFTDSYKNKKVSKYIKVNKIFTKFHFSLYFNKYNVCFQSLYNVLQKNADINFNKSASKSGDIAFNVHGSYRERKSLR